MSKGIGYKWPLSISSFTWLDRIKLASFVLNPKRRWTQGERVRQFEIEIAKLIGCRFAVFVSSGSTANTLLAMYVRDRCNKKRNTVVLPAVTWQTSPSPWIREGFNPHFIDVCRSDLSMDLDLLEHFLRRNADSVACVFITSLLGFSPDIEAIHTLASRFEVDFMLDNCESTLTEYAGKNISSYFTSTTSTYFAHHIQSVEGGFIFTDDQDLREYCMMARNHGMTRSVENSERYSNCDVDSRFDFFCLGGNFRNTDINATIGLMDLKRAGNYSTRRTDTYRSFAAMLDPVKYHLPSSRRNCTDVPFALPILRNNDWESKRFELIEICEKLGIESRPILSGNLLRHTAYERFRDPARLFPIANVLHSGIYVGLGGPIDYELMSKFAEALNSI